MKIIFLDVDGVLNNWNTKDKIDGFLGIDSDLLNIFKDLVYRSNKFEETNIVISSSWRLNISGGINFDSNLYKYLVNRLEEVGLSVFDNTPEFSECNRYDEVMKWIEENKEKYNVTGWCCIDDESRNYFTHRNIIESRNPCLDRLILTNPNHGIDQFKVNEALRILYASDEEIKSEKMKRVLINFSTMRQLLDTTPNTRRFQDLEINELIKFLMNNYIYTFVYNDTDLDISRVKEYLKDRSYSYFVTAVDEITPHFYRIDKTCCQKIINNYIDFAEEIMNTNFIEKEINV